MPTKIIMHVDLDYFYAQCEEKINPELRSKPIVVCVFSGRTEESGVVSTCNYLARKYTVKAGIPIVQAKRLLEGKNAVFLPMNRPLYEEVSERIMDLLRTHADVFEKRGIDEAFLDISNKCQGDYDAATELAREVKNEILTREGLTCSVGLAPNKLVAKMASDHEKPNGLTVVRPEATTEFLSQLPVDKLPGVGKKILEKLAALGVRSIGELARIDPNVLIDSFGKKLGGYLYQAARGEDDEPVQGRVEPTQFSRIGTLKQNTRDLAEIGPTLDKLTESVTKKLGDLSCKTVGIITILTDLSIHTKSRSLETPTRDPRVVKEISRDLLREFLTSTPNAVLRRVGVKLSGLSARKGQMDISTFLDDQS